MLWWIILIDIFRWILKTCSKQSDYDILPIIFFYWSLIWFKQCHYFKKINITPVFNHFSSTLQRKYGEDKWIFVPKSVSIYTYIKFVFYFTFLTFIDHFICCIVVCIYIPVLFNYLMNTIGLKGPKKSCRLRWVNHLVSRSNTCVSVYLKSCVIVITPKPLEDSLLVLVEQHGSRGIRTLSKTGCIY